MTARSLRPASAGRAAPLALILCLAAAPALAGLPDATIRRIVDLNVAAEENRQLFQSSQIDYATRSRRDKAIRAERSTLYRQIEQLPPDAERQAKAEIDGQTKLRLATLAPQWRARAEQSKQQQAQQDEALRVAVTADARAALESQRRRLLLQQRRDRGEISPQAFAAEDKKAEGEIAALRAKYARQGDQHVRRFNQELELMTQAIASNPAMPLPEPKVPAGGGGGTSVLDYQRDVSLAADLSRQRRDLGDQHFRQKTIDGPAYAAADKILMWDVNRLQKKWYAAGRGPEFDRDVQRGAAPPPHPAPPPVYYPPPRQAQPISPLVPLAGLLLLAYIGYRIQRARKRQAPTPVSSTYGSAHYAPFQTDGPQGAALCGVFLGKSSAPDLKGAPLSGGGAPIVSTKEHHVLIVAQTRTGKGTRVIVPTLLRYGGSALVIDPKGENTAITARTREYQLRQTIHVLNPWNELAEAYRERELTMATYNPLDILDRDDPNAVAIAQTLAGAICPTLAGDKDKFWQSSAGNVLTAVFLWLTDQPNEKKTLARAREIVSLSRSQFTKDFLIPMSASEAFGGAIREFAGGYIDLAPDTYSGIMTNLTDNTKFLSDPQIKAATAESSFSMEDLVMKNTTLYLVIPPDRMDTQKTWLRLMIAAAMNVFKHKRQENPNPKHRCLFLIDEFPALGRLPDIPRDIATMSGYGVDFALIVQNLDQLKDHYGEAKGTILSNCAYKWFCNVSDYETAKYLSDSLGKSTVRTMTSSDSYTSGNKSASGSHSTSHGETGKPLLFPDDILSLGRDVAICLQPLGRPYYLKPIDYWNLMEGFAALRETHDYLYWNPELAYDENPYHAKAKARPAQSNGMDEKRAREILDVTPTASRDEILAAYRRLMVRNHPDHGGTNHFAKELNAAKEFLLGE